MKVLNVTRRQMKRQIHWCCVHSAHMRLQAALLPERSGAAPAHVVVALLACTVCTCLARLPFALNLERSGAVFAHVTD